MPTLDIDRDAAHEAAQRELSKPIYPKASLTERLTEWIDELLYRIVAEGASVPGGWFTIMVLLILLAVAVVVAVRVARRTMRTNRGGSHRCSVRMSSAPPSTAPPPNSMRRRVIGRRRSGTGCEPSPGSWRRPVC